MSKVHLDDPDLYLDETMLLASMANSREIFIAITDLGVKEWFFNEGSNKILFKEIGDLIQQRTFNEYKAVLMGNSGYLRGMFQVLMKADSQKYIDMYHDVPGDPYPFLNFVTLHKLGRQEQCCKRISSQIQDKIKNNEDFHDLIIKLQELQDSHDTTNMQNCVQIAHAMDNETTKLHFTTGIQGFDEKVKLLESMLFVVAGESSSGKTSFTNQFVYNIIQTSKYDVLYFSLETTGIRLGHRFEAHIGKVENVDKWAARDRFRAMGNRLVVEDSMHEMDKIEKAIRDHARATPNLKVIVVDYLQLLECGIQEETPRVAYCTKALHRLGQELNLLVVLLCQLKKEEFSKGKGGKKERSKPTMHDLRGSAQIGNSADVISIGYFKDVHSDNQEVRDINLQIVKSKEGQQCQVQCSFFGKFFTFFDRED